LTVKNSISISSILAGAERMKFAGCFSLYGGISCGTIFRFVADHDGSFDPLAFYDCWARFSFQGKKDALRQPVLGSSRGWLKTNVWALVLQRTHFGRS